MKCNQPLQTPVGSERQSEGQLDATALVTSESASLAASVNEERPRALQTKFASTAHSALVRATQKARMVAAVRIMISALTNLALEIVCQLQLCCDCIFVSMTVSFYRHAYRWVGPVVADGVLFQGATLMRKTGSMISRIRNSLYLHQRCAPYRLLIPSQPAHVGCPNAGSGARITASAFVRRVVSLTLPRYGTLRSEQSPVSPGSALDDHQCSAPSSCERRALSG